MNDRSNVSPSVIYGLNRTSLVVLPQNCDGYDYLKEQALKGWDIHL